MRSETFKMGFTCRMATLNQFSSGYDYSQFYPAGAQYDATTGQYYDPQTGQYYDYSQYYQQYQSDKNTQSKSFQLVIVIENMLKYWLNKKQ